MFLLQCFPFIKKCATSGWFDAAGARVAAKKAARSATASGEDAERIATRSAEVCRRTLVREDTCHRLSRCLSPCAFAAFQC